MDNMGNDYISMMNHKVRAHELEQNAQNERTARDIRKSVDSLTTRMRRFRNSR